jgi:hypothetical protein
MSNSSEAAAGCGSDHSRSRGVVMTAGGARRCGVVYHQWAGAGRQPGTRHLGVCPSCRQSRSNGLVLWAVTGATAGIAGGRRWTGAGSVAAGAVGGCPAASTGALRCSRRWRAAAGTGAHVAAAIAGRTTTGRGDQKMHSRRLRSQWSSSRALSQRRPDPATPSRRRSSSSSSSSGWRGIQTGSYLHVPALGRPVQLDRQLLQALSPLATGSKQSRPSSSTGSGKTSRRTPRPSRQRASSGRCASSVRSGGPRLCSSSCGSCTLAKHSWSLRPGGSCCR